MPDLTAFLARALIAVLFIASGLEKVLGYSAGLAYMEAYGVPGVLLPAAIAVELVGGLAILAGFAIRWAALVLAVFTLLAAVLFHLDLADQTQRIMFLKNLAVAGGLLLLYAHGGGAWSMSRS